MEESILVELLENANKRYREGNPIMKDSDYDNYLEQLPNDHWYRNTIESEILSQTTYKHKDKMLSTDKCKTNDDVLKWISKVEKVSSNVNVRTSAKLDGLAGKYYETGELVTRGNGEKGNIVTSAFRKGVINISDSYGIGEIVVIKKYFDENLKGDFSHPRNLAVGITMSDNVTEKAQKALDNHAVHFAVYKDIYSITVTLEEFKKSYRSIEENVRTNTIYPIDGVVIEVVEPEIKEIMGDTSTYHRWMIALKPKDESSVSKVIDIKWNTGRTGRVTPVIIVEPVEIDGAIINRCTGHNAKKIIDMKIEIGCNIYIIRSGGVIPYCEGRV